jgi:MscS family membrane protein
VLAVWHRQSCHCFRQQKTSNLFGGVSVLADEVIRVATHAALATASVVDQFAVYARPHQRAHRASIPNGALAMNVENLTRRDKIFFNPTLQVRHETTPDQLRYLLAEVRRMLYEHPKVENSNANIRFTTIDTSSLALEISSFVLTTDAAEFSAIREDLLLRIMEIVKKSGTDFAFPSRMVYLRCDSGPDQEKVEAAERQVQQWRDERQLPFPDFAPADKSAFRGSITYPEPESAVGGGPR